jgi:CubicO group peptidase (beta-lactamase class C family)
VNHTHPSSAASAPPRPGVTSRAAAIALLLPLLAAAPPAHAQQARGTPSETPTLAPPLAVTDSVETAVDRVFAAYSHTGAPGCAVGVVQNGALVLAKGYGTADLDHGLAVRPTTVFETGSVAKQFTAATILLLEQEGVLSLDDPVRRWIPELTNLPPEVTLRTLLHHTSGVRDYLGLMQVTGRRPEEWYSARDVLSMLARQRGLTFAPGAAHEYSNSGYFLLSEVVQRASGRSLAEYARERIFEPLGMTHTHFHDDVTRIVPNRAHGYAPAPDQPHGFRILNPTVPIVGDGGVYTTIEDLALWNRNFDEPVVGGPAFVDRMLERAVLANGDTLGYALGIRDGSYRGLRIVWHNGANAGYKADFTRYPEQDMAVFTLCNRMDLGVTVLGRRVAEVFLGHLMEPAQARDAPRQKRDEPKPLAMSVGELAPYVGSYYAEELNTTYDVRLDGDTLEIAVGDWLEEPLVPVEPGVFKLGHLTVRFETDSTGKPAAFHLDTNWIGVFRFERRN